jgi:diadenosine tetraphosphate (Ap4A) HIT family hydrolase
MQGRHAGLSTVIAGPDLAIHDELQHCRTSRSRMTANSLWSLDPQLAADTVPVGELALARVLLANDAHYPWLILVPRKPALTELIDLDESAQRQLLAEVDAAARALKRVTRCDKLNIAALGNMVAQLHVHVIARRRSDAAWPKPVWGVVPPRGYESRARAAFIAAIRAELNVT